MILRFATIMFAIAIDWDPSHVVVQMGNGNHESMRWCMVLAVAGVGAVDSDCVCAMPCREIRKGEL